MNETYFTAGTTGALDSRGLRDISGQKGIISCSTSVREIRPVDTLRHTRPGMSCDISLLFAFAGVDDILDSRYSDGGLRNVRREDTFSHTGGCGREYLGLLTGR